VFASTRGRLFGKGRKVLRERKVLHESKVLPERKVLHERKVLRERKVLYERKVLRQRVVFSRRFLRKEGTPFDTDRALNLTHYHCSEVHVFKPAGYRQPLLIYRL